MHTNEPGSDGFNPTRVNVNVEGLQDFAALLHDELEANLRPNKDRIVADHRAGVGFGVHSKSADMHVAVTKYRECLRIAMANLDGYIQASEIIITATLNVVAKYQSANDLSSARLVDIEQLLGRAASEADAVRLEAARRAEIEQQAARMERRGLI